MAASESRVPSLYGKTLVEHHALRPAVSAATVRQAIHLCERAVDFIIGAAAIVACYSLQLHFGAHINLPLERVLTFGALAGAFAVLLNGEDGFIADSSGVRIRVTERAVRVSTQTVGLLLFVAGLLKLDYPIEAILIAFAVMPILMIAEKHVCSSLIAMLNARCVGSERAVVYGDVEACESLVSTLDSLPALGLRPVAVFGNSFPIDEDVATLSDCRGDSVPIHCGPISPTLLRSLGCSVLLVAAPPACLEDFALVTQTAEHAGMRVAFASRAVQHRSRGEAEISVEGWRLVAPSHPLSEWLYRTSKRIADVLVSAGLLILLAPFFLLIGLMIRLESAGPSIFVQKRVGKDGELFSIYKFRSMYRGTPKYGVSPTASSDSRITPLGRIVRRTSMDELPQLFNVLFGSMSLVGPRPEMPFIVDGYTEEHRRRLLITPGITGLWQLSADRALPIHENIEYDLDYICHRSFFLDVAILLHTLLFAIGAGI